MVNVTFEGLGGARSLVRLEVDAPVDAVVAKFRDKGKFADGVKINVLGARDQFADPAATEVRVVYNDQTDSADSVEIVGCDA